LGITILGFNEEKFWKTTPRKIGLLLDKHMVINGLKKETQKEGYIDQVLM